MGCQEKNSGVKSRLPDYANSWVQPEFFVGGDHRNILGKGLCNDLAIKWIGMIQRKAEKAKRMYSGIREHSEPQIGDPRSNVLLE